MIPVSVLKKNSMLSTYLDPSRPKIIKDLFGLSVQPYYQQEATRSMTWRAYAGVVPVHGKERERTGRSKKFIKMLVK